MKKTIFLSTLFLLSSIIVLAQEILNKKDIVGIWQFESSEMASGWGNTYTFFDDGSFIYRPSQYNSLKAIVAINGKYEIVKDNIVLMIKSITELVNGDVIHDVFQNSNNYWKITDFEVKERAVEPETFELYLEKNPNNKSKYLSIVLAGEVFYKLRNNPNDY